MHDELFHLLFNRKIQHYGTTIATLPIRFSRGTGHRDFARRVSRRPVRTKIRHSLFYPRCSPLHTRTAVPQSVLDARHSRYHRFYHRIGLFCPTDLKPDKVGMISGIFFGLMFGLGGIGSAFFGWLADETSIEFIFKVSTLLPLLGIIAGFLPNIKPSNR